MKRSSSLSAELCRQASIRAREWARRKAADLAAWHAAHAAPAARPHPLLYVLLVFLVTLGLAVFGWARFIA